MSGLTLEIITSAAALGSRTDDWWRLWARCPSATPFQSPAWLIPWWESFAPGPLRAAAVSDGRDLVALAPLYLETGPLGRRLLPLGISVSDYLDVLVNPEAGAGPALVGMVAERLGGWTRWELEEADEEATVLALPAPPDCDEELIEQSATTRLDLAPGLHVRDLVSPSQRRHLRLAANRAEHAGGLSVVEAGEGEIEVFLDILQRLHRGRWLKRGEEGVLADPRVQAFHRAAARRLLRAGIGRFMLALIGGRPAAALYLLVHGGRHMAYLSGFDPAEGHCSPGLLLLAAAVERAISEGAHSFEFLRGREAYKQSWRVVGRVNRRRSFVRRDADA